MTKCNAKTQPVDALIDLDAINQHAAIFLEQAPPGRLCLRAFHHEPGRPPLFTRHIQYDGTPAGGALVRKQLHDAAQDAARAGNVVFAPIWTILGSGTGTTEADALAGTLFWVDFDTGDPRASLTLAEGLIGQAHLVIETGGEAIDPETGRSQPRLSVWWMLSEPATGEDLKHLKRLMSDLAKVVGGDASGVSLVHPMRVNGSAHLKDPTNPKTAKTQAYRPNNARIELTEALEAVASALDARGILPDPEEPEYGDGDREVVEWKDDLIDLASTIPNDGPLEWHPWNRTGMAFYVASGGSDAGYEAFEQWSAKNPNLPPVNPHKLSPAQERWSSYDRSLPSRIGLPYLLKLAHRAHPGYRMPSEIENIRIGDEIVERLMRHRVEKLEAQAQQAALTGRIVVAGPQPDQTEPDIFDILPRPVADPLHPGGFLQRFMRECLASAARPQQQLALGAAIATVSVLGGRLFIGPTGLMTNLYIANLCPSTGGKEQPQAFASELLAQAGLVQLLGGRDITSDAALERMTYDCPTRLLFFDELSRILKPMLSDDTRLQMNASVATWLTSVFTKTSTVFLGKEYANPNATFGKDVPRRDISNPCVSILGSTVETGLWDNLGENAVRNGFIGRWLLFVAPRRLPYPTKTTTTGPSQELITSARTIREGAAGHDYGLRDLAQVAARPYEIPIQDDARAWIDDLALKQVDYQNSLPERDLRREIFGRLTEQVHKLAMICAVSVNSPQPVITMDSVQWGYATAMASAQLVADRVLNEVAANPFDQQAKHALRFIRQNSGRVNHTRLANALRLRKLEFRDVIDMLIETGEIKTVPENGTTFYQLIDRRKR